MSELDVTASTRQMWRGKDASNVLFLDRDASVRPDVVADARALPFRDGAFMKLYCDPPHIVRASKKNRQRGRFGEYGLWESRAEWVAFLYRVDEEFSRVLAPKGTLWFKTISGGHPKTNRHNMIQTRDLGYLKRFEVVSRESYPSKHKFTLGGGLSHVTTDETLLAKVEAGP